MPPRKRVVPGDTAQGEGGWIAGAETLPFGFLILVVGALLLANAWGVVDAKLAVSAAAREGARSFVESEPDLAEDGATASAAATLAAFGRDLAEVTVGNPEGFRRCARVSVTVSHRVPALVLPWIGGFGEGFTVTSTHSEIVDPFRDGVPGNACD